MRPAELEEARPKAPWKKAIEKIAEDLIAEQEINTIPETCADSEDVN